MVRFTNKGSHYKHGIKQKYTKKGYHSNANSEKIDWTLGWTGEKRGGYATCDERMIGSWDESIWMDTSFPIYVYCGLFGGGLLTLIVDWSAIRYYCSRYAFFFRYVWFLLSDLIPKRKHDEHTGVID